MAISLIVFLTGGCAVKTPPKTEVPLESMGDRYNHSADEMAVDGQFKTSNFFYLKAISEYEKNGAWGNIIKCYIKIGDNYQKSDDVATALRTLNQALEISKSKLGYQNLELAKSFQKLAFKYLQDKDYDRALELYQKALAIQLEILDKNHPDIAKTYNSISLVYWHKKQPVEANKNYLASYGIKLQQFEGVPNDLDKNYKSTLPGEKKFKKGEFNKARNHFENSLEEYKKLFGSNKPLFVSVYEQIGILHALEGDYTHAMENLRKAFNLRLEIYGDNTPEAGTGYLNIGICLRLQGELAEAFNFLTNALTIKSEKLGEFHPDNSDIYCQLGKTCFQLDQLDKALEYFQKALIALVPGYNNNRIDSNPLPDNLLPKEKLLEILEAKADTLRLKYIKQPDQLQYLQVAYSTYLRIVDLVEIMRRGYKSESYKLFFGEKSHTIFQKAIQASLFLYDATKNPGYKESAFILSEKSKAAVLAEALAESHARQFAGIPDALLEKEKKLKENLTNYDTYLQKEYQAPNPDRSKIQKLENLYYNLVLDYRHLIDQFETKYKKYYELKYKPVEIDIPSIQQSLEPGSALIEYFIGDSSIHIFVLTGKKLDIVNVVPDDDMNEMVESYIGSIKKIEEISFLQQGRNLYQLLFKPVRQMLEGKTHVIIIPDGPLYTLPFESLITGFREDPTPTNQDYLIGHYDFSYHYSANLWLYSARHRWPGMEMTFIGFAPVFTGKPEDGYVLETGNGTGTAAGIGTVTGTGNRSDSIRAGTVRTASPAPQVSDPANPVSQLPASEEELREIIDLFKSRQKNAAGYFHGKASESNFKTMSVKGFNLVHIATHSTSDSGKELLAGLIFSPSNLPGQPLEKDDGILYSGEIYNLRTDADLIVLSSCESGLGKLVKGEGMMALNRGFFYSGIYNIIYSLWKVEDRSTSRLMILFYKNILDGHPFSTALRLAKLELIKNPYTAFPKYWSGFVLVGK